MHDPAPLPGEWPDYRRDEARTAVQPLPGRVLPGRVQKSATEPELKAIWSLPLGGGYQEVEPVGDGTGDLLLADAGGVQRISLDGEVRWRSVPFGAHWLSGVYDLDGDGTLEIVTSNGRELVLLSAETGRILFRYDVGPPFSYGTYATMFQVHRFFPRAGFQILVPCFSNKEVLLFDCSHSGLPSSCEQTELLHRLWMDDGYHPTIAIGDINRDGRDEIVIARLGGVYAFDAESGHMISETLWNSDEERRRNYGQVALADIDDDGDLEVVLLSDKVTRHIAVLDNDGTGRFRPLWDRFIQHIYPEDTTELRFTHHSLFDVDGDGRLELTISLFNERGDERWYTEVLDPVTGRILREFPDRYLRGIQLVDDMPLLCLSEEHQRTPARFSTITVYSANRPSAKRLSGATAELARRGARRGGSADPPQRGFPRRAPQSGFPWRAGLQPLWQHPNARFADRTMHTTATRSEFKPDVFGEMEVWAKPAQHAVGAAPNPALYVLTPSNEGEALSALEINGTQSTLKGLGYRASVPFRIAAIDGESLVISRSDGVIERVTDTRVTGTRVTEAGQTMLAQTGYHLTTEAHIAARPGVVASVTTEGDASFLVYPDFRGYVHIAELLRDRSPRKAALRKARRGEKAALRHVAAIKGRSRLGYDNVFHAASIISTDEGKRIVIVDDDDALDHSRVSLYDLSGRVRRRLEFADLPSSMSGSRRGCYDWLYFRHSRGEALMLSFFQSASMNSECSLGVLIATGEVLWRIDRFGEGDYGRGVAPWGTSILRYLNPAGGSPSDGTPHAIFLAKDTLCMLDLERGTLARTKLVTEFTALAMREAGRLKEQGLSTHSSIDDPFTAYGSPIAIGEDTFIAGSFGGFGLIDKDWNVRWWKIASFGDVLYRMPGLGDLGAARTPPRRAAPRTPSQSGFPWRAPVVGQPHGDGVFRIYDAANGELVQEIPLAAVATDVLTIDVNGDGRMEFVVGTNDGRLLVIGFRDSQYSIFAFWEAATSGAATMGAPIAVRSGMGSPIAAELGHTGKADILVASADGELTCFEFT